MDMSILGWVLAGGLVLVGLIGTVVPMLPGAALIVAGAFCYQWFLAGPGQGLGWVTLAGLVGLMVVSYLLDLAAGVWGARKFGASRAGIWGGVLGLVVGLGFGLPGLICGPPIGVLLGELFSGKETGEALRVTWGTVVGTALGMLARLGIALVMTAWLVVAVVRVWNRTP